MGSEPIAFLSYAKADDEHDGHSITAFREALQSALRIHTGQRLTIFQDRDLAWGEAWRERIDGSLDAVAVLIPILTPSFFASKECRRELARFLEREGELGRRDLVLPVYWVEAPEVDDPAVRAADTQAAELAARQRVDWRDIRFDPLTSPESRREISRLAIRIRDTIRGVASAPQEKPRGSAGRQHGGRQTHVVNSEGDDEDPAKGFRTIAAAIDNARPNDVILVRPGRYVEHLILEEPIEIVGDGSREEIVVEAGGSDTILFEAYRGRIENLTLRQRGEGDAAAVRIERGKLELEKCEVQSNESIGIVVSGGADPTVTDCLVHRCAHGVVVHNGGAGTFADNIITRNNEHGVVISRGGNPRLRANRIVGNRHYGVMVIGNALSLLEDNDVMENGWSGLGILGGANPAVRRNRLTGNSHYAIWITAGGLGTIDDNDMTANDWGGIGVTEGGNPTVRNNRIMNNGQFGVWVKNGLGTFIGNSLVNNTDGPWNVSDEVFKRLRVANNIGDEDSK
ncbi:MAG TPA: right-handed parallel beta-helix repeat-containing protein [Solirubrobacterales bacterium]|nr:right-handed parallel beta-helix repeat-containing protein [Solirubrobacterales bacterium]